MSPEIIIRAWKDEDFRSRLSPEELNALPDNPAGPLLLDAAELPEDDEARSVLGWCPELLWLEEPTA